MKKFLAIILAALMLLTLTACGKKDSNQESSGSNSSAKDDDTVTEQKEYDEGPVAELKWTLEAGVLTISGKGRMPDFYSDEETMLNRPWEKDTNAITSVVISEGITSISSHAFMFCRSMTSVTIPASVVAIGKNAFYCCYDLAEITLPSGTKMIGDFAFKGCTSLPKISYRGAASQWDEISLGEEAVPVPKIACTDGDIVLAAEAPETTATAQEN